jgi:putative addiction module component (TIGR02574 family)
MTTLEEVLAAAQNLSLTEQIQLIDALAEAFPPEKWPAPSDEWIAEAQRRSAEYDAGRMAASTWPEVRERSRRKAGLDG